MKYIISLIFISIFLTGCCLPVKISQEEIIFTVIQKYNEGKILVDLKDNKNVIWDKVFVNFKCNNYDNLKIGQQFTLIVETYEDKRSQTFKKIRNSWEICQN